MTRETWDRHSIMAEVRRRGETLRGISRRAGLCANACTITLGGRRWRRAEQALADFLGVPARDLFPDRYGAAPKTDGSGKSPLRKVKSHERNERREAA
jgi:Ner family transcriptional regulator